MTAGLCGRLLTYYGRTADSSDCAGSIVLRPALTY